MLSVLITQFNENIKYISGKFYSQKMFIYLNQFSKFKHKDNIRRKEFLMLLHI